VIESVGNTLMWSVFAGVVVTALALDLFVFHRRAHEVHPREAGAWVLVWIGLAAAFCAWIWTEAGHRAGLEFATGYLVEYALSVDNIFVFIVIFRYFGTPSALRHRVLFWGIVGAVVLRAAFVIAGAALISRFHWVIYIFGAFLVWTGLGLLRKSEMEVDPEKNPVLRFLRRHLRITKTTEGQRFLVPVDGKLFATPLLVELLVIEATDVVFAVDSIPAIFGVTHDPFIVFTSNIFAVLGLRAIYFLLHDLMDRFVYLHFGLGLVLSFIGTKMLIGHWVEIPVQWSLAVVGALLAGSVIVSWLFGPKDEEVERFADEVRRDDDADAAASGDRESAGPQAPVSGGGGAADGG
jgi:tellurite resistance protein TerC